MSNIVAKSSCPISFTTGGGASPRRYDLIIPTKDNERQRIRPAVVRYFQKKMSEHFDGSTTVDAEGCYFSQDSGRHECEPVKVVTSIRNYDLTRDAPCTVWLRDDNFMDDLANEIAQDFGQEGVLGITSPLDTFYIGGEKRPRAFPELIG